MDSYVRQLPADPDLTFRLLVETEEQLKTSSRNTSIPAPGLKLEKLT